MNSQSAGHAERGSGHIWRFGDCELDERRRELRVGGTPVDIEGKPLEVLQQLLLHAGEVVTKAELLESVWPGVAVVDGSLATAVSKVRRILKDDENAIVTVPRVGYKLAVPVYCSPLPAPSRPDLLLEAGQRIPGRDQWRLVLSLDQSPSSEVWLGQHPKTREIRVFKFASDDLRLRCLKREVTVARLLRESLGDRPEFVRVLEWNFDRRPYFVESEYAGANLAEWADAQGGLGNVPWDLRLKLLVDVARAVASAHELDVLHKDLKPGNILVASTPDGAAQIKVADFGSASLLEPARLGALSITNLGFTRSGTDAKDSLTGTVMYLAPEVLAGQSPTATSDVYALGVLLYQLAVGEFRRPLAPGWEADIPDPLIREDIAKAACGDPARRFKTAAALVDRLVNLDRRRSETEETRRLAQSAERRRIHGGIRGRWLVLGSATLVMAAAVGLGIGQRPAPATPRLKTVAVLPFHNVASDESVDFLRLALPDQIATTLSHTRGLSVRPFATTSRYEEPVLDVLKAGKEMRVDSVVTGRFVRARDQLHITLEAIDVASNTVLWREKVDAPASSMIATQIQVALEVRRGLVPAFGATATDAVTPPKNDAAYELFLRSLALTFDAEPNPRGIAMLERAVELDPTYAPAWVALARRYYVEARYTSGGAAMIDRAEAASERALALVPTDASAAGSVVGLRVERGDLVGAHERARDFLRQRPDSVHAHFSMSYVLRYAGLLDESASHCESAFLLDPQTDISWIRSCAIVFFVRGDYPRALTYLNLDRGSDWARAFSIDMLVRQGNIQAALEMESPNMSQFPSYDLLLACVRARPSDEIDTLARAVRPAEDPESNYLSAAHLAYCGRTEAAGELLRRAIDGNYCSYPAIDSDPLFARLRAKPEYADLRAAGLACQNRFLAERHQRRP